MKRILPTNDLIREVLGENHPVPMGWQVLIQTYNFGDKFMANGEESILERPDSSKDRDRYQLGLGRILMVGDAAFKGQSFKDWGIVPEIGDYVSFQRYEGVFKTFTGPDGEPVNCQYLKDYLVLDIVQDPAISSYHHFVGA